MSDTSGFCLCKGKYKLKIRGLILPVENKGTGSPPLLSAFYFRNFTVDYFFFCPFDMYINLLKRLNKLLSSFRAEGCFLMDLEPPLQNTTIMEDGAPVSRLLWEDRSLTSDGCFIPCRKTTS